MKPFFLTLIMASATLFGQNQNPVPDFIIKDALSRANIVILGEVLEIDPIKLPPKKIISKPNQPIGFPPKDNGWNLAKIYSAETLKGKTLIGKNQQTEVYFLTNDESTPKLSVGQIGIFLIKIEGNSFRFKDLTDFDKNAKTISGSADSLPIKYLRKVKDLLKTP